MLNYSCFYSLTHKKRIMFLSLVLCWFLGLLLGTLLAFRTSPFSLSMMRIVISDDVSIVGMLLSVLLPFVITVVAYWASSHFLIVIFAWLNSFMLSFCTACLCTAFKDAAWLIHILFLFSDICLATSMLYLWISVILQGYRMFKEKCVIIFVLNMFLTIIDYVVVAPFLRTLF